MFFTLVAIIEQEEFDSQTEKRTAKWILIKRFSSLQSGMNQVSDVERDKEHIVLPTPQQNLTLLDCCWETWFEKYVFTSAPLLNVMIWLNSVKLLKYSKRSFLNQLCILHVNVVSLECTRLMFLHLSTLLQHLCLVIQDLPLMKISLNFSRI